MAVDSLFPGNEVRRRALACGGRIIPPGGPAFQTGGENVLPSVRTRGLVVGGSAEETAAVEVEEGAGHEGRGVGGEVEDGVRDVGGGGVAAQGRLPAVVLHLLGRAQALVVARGDDAGHDG